MLYGRRDSLAAAVVTECPRPRVIILRILCEITTSTTSVSTVYAGPPFFERGSSSDTLRDVSTVYTGPPGPPSFQSESSSGALRHREEVSRGGGASRWASGMMTNIRAERSKRWDFPKTRLLCVISPNYPRTLRTLAGRLRLPQKCLHKKVPSLQLGAGQYPTESTRAHLEKFQPATGVPSGKLHL